MNTMQAPQEGPDVAERSRAMAATVHVLAREADHHLTRLHQILQHLESLSDDLPVTPPPAHLAGELAPDCRSKLTNRERQVLELLIRGSSNRRIARALNISEPTVKNHLHSVFQKLDVADRTQAIAKVLGGPRPAPIPLRSLGPD
jgi:ATP/maltotriose-dependent transcriptional regulator MalT